MNMMPRLLLTGLVVATLTGVPTARAHCDSLDGPVVVDARLALAEGDVTPVLKWVRADDEAAIRAAFAQTIGVRRLSPAAADLADRFFFETLVRIHRAGEGAAFTGLKPAGGIDPAIAAADLSLVTGRAEALVRELQQRIAIGLGQRFERAREARAHADHNVDAGRAYVAAYVDFIHYYEALHGLAVRSGTHEAAHQH
jgi:hypothetical protein